VNEYIFGRMMARMCLLFHLPGGLGQMRALHGCHKLHFEVGVNLSE